MCATCRFTTCPGCDENCTRCGESVDPNTLDCDGVCRDCRRTACEDCGEFPCECLTDAGVAAELESDPEYLEMVAARREAWIGALEAAGPNSAEHAA